LVSILWAASVANVTADDRAVTAVLDPTRLYGFMEPAAPAPRDFTVQHDLARELRGAVFIMTSGGAFCFQTTPWDDSDLYSVPSGLDVTRKVRI
jgi:hypothetical protein